MEPAPRTAPREWHYLPRLDPACYRAFAAVLWTITFERCASGWLDAAFHAHFRECLLHAAAREGLYCPTYVLDNPRRHGWVSHPREWPYLGAIVPGYPFLHPLADDFWLMFWKLYAGHREPTPNASPLLAGPGSGE